MWQLCWVRTTRQPWRCSAGMIAAAGVLLLLLRLAPVAAAEEEFTCQTISKVPQPQRCHFVKTACDANARIPFMELYYCSVEPAGWLAKVPFVLLLCAVLPLLFTLLGDTAELYFSPTMAVVAQSIPKMRPRFAGVTFVAMGNGAADLSANISAIRSGSVQLSAGAFTGAAMFVQCVVASEVIRISQGAPCRGATMRDVATYAISIIGVALSFGSGLITRWFVAGALIVYAAYVAWVFMGDEWHARGRPRPNISWSQLLDGLRERTRGGPPAEPAQQWASFEAAEPLLPADSLTDAFPPRHTAPAPFAATHTQALPGAGHSAGISGGGGGGGRTAHLIDAETYRQAVWADLSSDPTLVTAVRTGRAPLRSLGSDSASLELQTGVSGTVSTMPYTYTAPPTASSAGSTLSTLREGRSLASSAGVGDGEPHGASPRFTPLAPSSVPTTFQLPQQQQQQQRMLVPPPHTFTDVESLGVVPEASTAPMYDTFSNSNLNRVGPGPGAEAGAGGVPLAALRGQDVLPLPGSGGSWNGKEAAGPGAGVGAQAASHAAATAGSTPLGGLMQAGGGGTGGGAAIGSMWQQICAELTVGAAHEWPHLSGVRRRFRSVTFPILLPLYAALRISIPLIDPATYSQQWLVVTMLCAPLATLAYLDAFQPWPAAVALAVGVALATLVHILTKDEEELPALDLGTSFEFGPAVFSLMGFFMGVLWIDTFASEVVGILSLLANLAGLPSSLMGLTLLAWGSSLGDLFGNAALARRGHASTALTACFAGPLFNMLVSLALGFSANFASHGTSSLQVRLSPDVTLGCVFLVCYNVAVAVVGFSNRFRLPQRFYLFARAWYALYLLLACGFGLAEMLGWGASS